MRSGIRSKRGTAVAARRRLNRPQSWRRKTARAATMQSVKTSTDTMTPPSPALRTRSRTMQIRAALALVLTACTAATGPLARIATPGGTSDVALEVADTPDTRARGRMYRTSLPDGQGMLCVFDAADDRAF